MIKTNIKMRVTPEQSAKVQEICFENGIFWNASTKKDVLDTRGKFLYIENTITHDVPWENGNDIIEMEDFFKKNDLLEINPDFFIRTNGTCIEKEEFTYPMWFESKTTKEVVRFDGLSKGEVIVSKNKDFPVGFYSLNIEPHTSIIWKQIENPNLATDKEIEQVINEEYEKDSSINNGGKTDYYQLENAPFKINDFDDFAEWRGLNGNQFNMGKVMWTFNVGRHSATDYERELNKVIHYANREKLRISRELKNEN